MVHVFPSLLSETESEFRSKLEQVRNLVDMVHVDVMDGQFVPNTCWANPEIVKTLLPPPAFGVHLMVKNPDDYLVSWAGAGAIRLEVHVEVVEDWGGMIKKIHELGCEVGVVLNPETAVERVMPFLDKIDFVLVMGVSPGASGQHFMPEVLPKIKKLRETRPDLSIGVDGGINKETARQVIAAGADTLISTNYLFSGENVAERLKELQYGIF